MRTPIRKRKSTWFLALIAAVSFVLFIREPLLAIGSRFYVARTLQAQGWSIGAVKADKNRVLLEDLSGITPYGAVTIERVDVEWHLALSPLCLEPKVAIFGPQVIASLPEEGGFGKGELPLPKGSFFSPKITVEDGQLLFADEEKVLMFKVAPGEDKGELGTLFLYEEEGADEIVRVSAHLDKKEIIVSVEMLGAPLTSLRPFVTRI